MTVFEKVSAIIRAEFPSFRDLLTRETTAHDVDGWDSLAHTSLILRIESELNVEIDPDAAMNFENIGALADYVEAQL